MGKKDLKIDTSPSAIVRISEESEPYFCDSKDLRSFERLKELVDTYGVVYVPMPKGVPLKITKASLG